MQGFQSLLFALVASLALSAATMSNVALASQVDAAAAYQQHQARGHNTVRSLVLDHGKRLKAKRATQAQQEAAARSKEWSDNFGKQNAAWQASANEDLKQGKTPQEFDAWSAKNSGGQEGNDSAAAAPSSKPVPAYCRPKKQAAKTEPSTDKQASTNQQQDSNNNQQQQSNNQQQQQESSNKQQQQSSNNNQQHDNQSKSNQKSSSNNNSGSSGSGLLAGIKNVVQGGKMTYYSTGLGACGWTNKDSDFIVALPVGVWNRIGGPVSNGNIVCGKKLKISNGKTAIEAEIADQCPSCDDSHLDLSPAAFRALGDQSAGVVPISWGWVNGEPSS